jgi:hypothetical protein
VKVAAGIAASGASLDTDDVAGEIGQDRGEGRVPFPQDSLPNGGGGGSERVVLNHSGKDWAADIGIGIIRMKEETQQPQGNTGNQGGGVFSSGKKWALGAQKGIETALCQRTVWEKFLQTNGTGRESRKMPMRVVGKKPYGRC